MRGALSCWRPVTGGRGVLQTRDPARRVLWGRAEPRHSRLQPQAARRRCHFTAHRHQFASFETKTTWGNQESSRAGWTPEVRRAIASRACRSSAGWWPWAEQGRLLLIVTDRKYVLKMKCPDRLRLNWSPRRSLQSGDSGCSSSAVRSSYGDASFGERAAGEWGWCMGSWQKFPPLNPKGTGGEVLGKARPKC